MTELENELGIRIRALRAWRGMSQNSLAKEANIRRTHLSQIENGKFAARIDTLYAISKALDVTLAFLFTNVG